MEFRCNYNIKYAEINACFAFQRIPLQNIQELFGNDKTVDILLSVSSLGIRSCVVWLYKCSKTLIKSSQTKIESQVNTYTQRNDPALQLWTIRCVKLYLSRLALSTQMWSRRIIITNKYLHFPETTMDDSILMLVLQRAHVTVYMESRQLG